mgnify:CR=1 FL=1
MTQRSNPTPEPAADVADAGTVLDMNARMIDIWFPLAEVDAAVRTPAGSGRNEKALFTWFASRPIAQARAAVLCSLLPDSEQIRRDIRLAVSAGDDVALARLREQVVSQFGSDGPVVLDMFSGRGILPLEAARIGATAIGTDLSPVATLAGRLLADYPLRDWSDEPDLPFGLPDAADPDEDGDEQESRKIGDGVQLEVRIEPSEPRLLTDVRRVLAEVGRRVAQQVGPLYRNAETAGQPPWAYLWAVTITCDGCGRRFPLIGSMVLQYPNTKSNDKGQALRLAINGDEWATEVHAGAPRQEPTYASAPGRRGKTARCPFPQCRHSHSLDVVKAKGFAGQYEDRILVVVEIDEASKRKVFRAPHAEDLALARKAQDTWASLGDAAPREAIPDTAGVDARNYGYATYGDLMNTRQAVMFACTARVIDEMFTELCDIVSEEYARALTAYAAANIPKQIRRSTRGANLLAHGKPSGAASNTVQIGDLFSSQSVIKHQFDYIEAGPWSGPGTWTSVSSSLLGALRKVLADNPKGSRPGRFRRASAVALPFRDASVDVLVTDPPYYQMVAYADSSDIFHVWLKRALKSAMPDLFAGSCDASDGLQDKSEEVIVKGRGAAGKGDHRTADFYEAMLARSFVEAKRVLKPDGHLTVIFGHADPDAWKRLLTALTEAGFVVTSSWPSRTETAVTGVATISVTVSIGAQVAPQGRPVGIASEVDAEVLEDVKGRCREWDADGLALEDQLMASYGAALQVVGRYERVITPAGEVVPLEHYMTLSRRAVRDAIALRLGEQPLETFDPFTRLAVFWHETYGRADVPKGEARFFAQSDSLRLEDLRGPIFEETKAGFRLRHDAPERVTSASSAYEVVRAMAAAQPAGTDAVAAQLSGADRPPTDAHVWALVDWLAAKLPSSDPVAVSLAAIKRNIGTIQKIAAGQTKQGIAVQPALFEETK